MTAAKDRYLIGEMVRRGCEILGVSEHNVLRRVGLPDDYVDTETKGVTPRQCFDMWRAFAAEIDREDALLELSRALVHAPQVPAMYAFSCSPDIESGLTRLALFKPLVAPCALEVQRVGDTVVLTAQSSDPIEKMPEVLCLFEVLYFVECFRLFTNVDIRPLSVGGPMRDEDWSIVERFTGVAPVQSDVARIVLSVEDATRPLVTRSERLWEHFGADLERRLEEKKRRVPYSAKVRVTLVQMLPSGQCSVDDVCRRQGVSKRTLQRRLSEEGTTFQEVLAGTRAEMSMKYLEDGHLSISEISYLLGYQDQRSFFRAFQGWTGKTPMEARATVLQ
ncbi:MAG: helix-turn-helix domain-containing protein [Rhodobacteraceae bacterium]|nr:helix-turn-helix domain-containing protein [Paracoccaceae bacterium]